MLAFQTTWVKCPVADENPGLLKLYLRTSSYLKIKSNWILYRHSFLYKDLFYNNMEAEILQNFKDKPEAKI